MYVYRDNLYISEKLDILRHVKFIKVSRTDKNVKIFDLFLTNINTVHLLKYFSFYCKTFFS